MLPSVEGKLGGFSRQSLLHDRATLGKVLTPEEQARLDAWYAEKDAAQLGLGIDDLED